MRKLLNSDFLQLDKTGKSVFFDELCFALDEGKCIFGEFLVETVFCFIEPLKRNLFLCVGNVDLRYCLHVIIVFVILKLHTLCPRVVQVEKEKLESVKRADAAVKTMHDNGWLHLDIKAENVLIDDDGLAVLGDLGISQHWDENGNKTTKGVSGIGSQGASIRQKTNDDKFASEFHPEQDIYSLAALYYLIITGNAYHRDFEPEDLEEYDISEESKAAITAALVGGDTLETTPKDVLEFMRMLPGCQDLELPVIQPACMEDNESIDFDDWDFDMDDLELPDFNTDDLPTSPGSASTY